VLRASINATERVAADATCEAEASYNRKGGEKNVIYINTIFLIRKNIIKKN